MRNKNLTRRVIMINKNFKRTVINKSTFFIILGLNISIIAMKEVIPLKDQSISSVVDLVMQGKYKLGELKTILPAELYEPIAEEVLLKEADALCSAIYDSNAKKVQNLLENSNNPETLISTQRSCRPSLRQAVEQENEEIVNLLLKYGAKPDQEDSYDITALMIAALTGNLNIASHLIRSGANVNAKDRGGQSVLSYVQFSATTDEQKTQLTKLLKDNGAVE